MSLYVNLFKKGICEIFSSIYKSLSRFYVQHKNKVVKICLLESEILQIKNGKPPHFWESFTILFSAWLNVVFKSQLFRSVVTWRDLKDGISASSFCSGEQKKKSKAYPLNWVTFCFQNSKSEFEFGAIF